MMSLKGAKNVKEKNRLTSRQEKNSCVEVKDEVGKEANEVEVENVFPIESHTGTTKSITLCIFVHYAFYQPCQHGKNKWKISHSLSAFCFCLSRADEVASSSKF